MTKFLRISNSYHLGRDNNNCYQLYNKVKGKSYVVTFKLYTILKLFYNEPNTIENVRNEFRKLNIEINDFLSFVRKDQFRDLLVEVVEVKDYSGFDNNFSCSDRKGPTLSRVDFFITKHCNLCCKHCFEGSAPTFKTKAISRKEINNLMEQLKIANIQTLKITGGEPFTHPNIKHVLKAVMDAHFETIILTNATLIDDESISMIKSANIQLGISLDGITSETHDYIRGKGAFDKTITVLHKLSKERIRFAITCSVTSKNWEQLTDIADFVFNKINAEVLYLNRIRPMGRARQSSVVMSDKENQELSMIMTNLKRIYKDKIVLSDDSKIVCKSNSDIIHCAAGNTLLAIDENFDVYPCVYGIGNSHYKIGNILVDGVGKVWESSQWDIFRGQTKLSDLLDCRDCTFNKTCIMKNCRLKPIFEGRSFYSSISYCNKNIDNV